MAHKQPLEATSQRGFPRPPPSTSSASCEIGGDFEGYECQQGGTTTATAPLKPGYWRPGPTYERLLKCPDLDGWCVGGTDGDVCAEGHDPQYPYCSACLKTTADGTRWYKSVSSGCLMCESSIPVEVRSLNIPDHPRRQTANRPDQPTAPPNHRRS